MRRETSPDEQIQALQALQSNLTRVLVTVAVVAMAFTATNVTLFAIDHHIPAVIAWLLDPIVAVALGAVLIVDGRLSEHGVNPSGWATTLRWFAGLSTWLMNCWSSLWPAATPFGMPRHIDPAGLVLHSIPPVLLIVLAEAITYYRRAILDRIAVLRGPVDTPRAAVDTAPAQQVSTVSAPPAPATAKRPVPVASPLVICGAQHAYTLTVPPHSHEREDDEREPERLSTEQALDVIRECWEQGESIRSAARQSTRSPSYVQTVYAKLTAGTQEPSRLALTAGTGR
ncbi:hypothetical protein G3I40_08660 [Streptomyces sp. SID14478]|uniref:hypothetical protein n=1 Tax=Streptomyces sp. SID14478 TaxID=2706073 RepID=UPI0013D99769|nr:hypothetical protein [Streptomyces sp. SID14478]NEB75301.1 hypothetical protein [Streptomyces sp. SID14478]